MNRHRDIFDFASKGRKKRTAGFTLLELMVVIVVFGILCAAVAVNWSSFIKHQNLRAEASGFHKELMALKAKALEKGGRVQIEIQSNAYKVAEETLNDDGTHQGWEALKSVSMRHNITLSLPEIEIANTPNKWRISANSGTLLIKNAHLDAYDNGCVMLSNNSKKNFFIRMDTTVSIKPELFSRSGNSCEKM
ncbi:MAG: prepilin-type N-terminal cleavage/methylation domain-containing protein [Chitinispirillia bacterium]|nr:prepilin-type N-terminal cleavage/methylation domain-containing protein [Chitinispirillia bacterium]MCL2268670.1 prepilin-type N-terminal cleavage/methylation domain-containing protein [Chitinispirillia bacterium]